jgi:hypothetical protein
MDLVQRLYPQADNPKFIDYLTERWSKFILFHPGLLHLGSKPVSHAISQGNTAFFINQLRNIYLPDQTDEEVQESFRQAMNRGISSINQLCQDNLGEYADPFVIAEVQPPLDLFGFMKGAREEWIMARNGRHNGQESKRQVDKDLLLRAYDRVRNWGLGYHVLMVDEAPEVIASLRHNGIALEWFARVFDFRNNAETDVEDLPNSWDTNAGVRVYGLNSPIRSRLKIKDNKTGMPNYGSIIMKMLIKGAFPDAIQDYAGVEFIVEDETSVDKLTSFFSTNLRGTARLEAFKKTRRRRKREDNPYSSPDFDCTKFIIRPPVPIQTPLSYPGQHAYERVRVEVQVLTLQAHQQRKENPDLTHEQYKARQFATAFPILFPKQIYEHLIN